MSHDKSKHYTFRVDGDDHSKLTMILLLAVGVKFEVETHYETEKLSPIGDCYAKSVSIIKIKKEDIESLGVSLESLNPNREHSHARV